MGPRLYVSNLPLSATEEGLTTRFRKFGVVLSVAFDPGARRSRRGAFVEMDKSSEARSAIAGLNLSDFDGRLVSVYLAPANALRKEHT